MQTHEWSKLGTRLAFCVAAPTYARQQGKIDRLSCCTQFSATGGGVEALLGDGALRLTTIIRHLTIRSSACTFIASDEIEDWPDDLLRPPVLVASLRSDCLSHWRDATVVPGS